MCYLRVNDSQDVLGMDFLEGVGFVTVAAIDFELGLAFRAGWKVVHDIVPRLSHNQAYIKRVLSERPNPRLARACTRKQLETTPIAGLNQVFLCSAK